MSICNTLLLQQQPQNLTSTSLSTVSNSRPTAATALLVQQQPLLSQAAKQQQQLTTVTSLHQPAAQQQQQQPQQLGTTVIKTSAAASATPSLATWSRYHSLLCKCSRGHKLSDSSSSSNRSCQHSPCRKAFSNRPSCINNFSQAQGLSSCQPNLFPRAG